MQFDVSDRLTLQGILPAEGNFVTMKVIRDLRSALSFSEEEIADFEIKENGDRVTWDKTKEEPKDVDIGGKATEIIVSTLERMDREKKLAAAHLPLYEKFMSGE